MKPKKIIICCLYFSKGIWSFSLESYKYFSFFHAFSDKSSTSNMKIDSLSFLGCILTQHDPEVFYDHIHLIVPVCIITSCISSRMHHCIACCILTCFTLRHSVLFSSLCRIKYCNYLCYIYSFARILYLEFHLKRTV